MSEKDYVMRSGIPCPFCESEDVDTTGPVQTDIGVAWQPVFCNDCGKEWNDQYTLTGFAPI